MKHYYMYEVLWANEYTTFQYMKDVRKYLKGKSRYTVNKYYYNRHGEIMNVKRILTSI